MKGKPKTEQLHVRGTVWHRLTFTEGGFREHVGKLKTAPHLWCYMLGYSKILMADAMGWLKSHGAVLLYTDTDGSHNSTLAKISPRPNCAGCINGE